MTQEEEIEILRELLAFAYSGARLYTDDGALHDTQRLPFIDFRNDPVDVLQRKIIARNMNQLNKTSINTYSDEPNNR